MLDPSGIDMFPTKGIEYVLVILFLAALILFWRWLGGSRSPAPAASFARARARRPSRWFDLPEGRYFHAGHAWAVPAGGGIVRVGMDDFSQKLVGLPSSVRLPAVGEQLHQGRPGWGLQVGGRSVPQLSPVDGVVVARNEALASDPTLVNRDPYEGGWLLEVEVPPLAAGVKTLMRGALARAWLQTSEDALFGLMPREVGVVMQDGGIPVTGIARALSPRDWDRIAAEFLLTD